MDLSEQEVDVIEILRDWSADTEKIRLSVSFEDGAWEATLTDANGFNDCSVALDVASSKLSPTSMAMTANLKTTGITRPCIH